MPGFQIEKQSHLASLVHSRQKNHPSAEIPQQHQQDHRTDRIKCKLKGFCHKICLSCLDKRPVGRPHTGARPVLLSYK